MCTGVYVNGIGKGTALNLAYRSLFNRANNSLSDGNCAATSYSASVLCGCVDDGAAGSLCGNGSCVAVYGGY